MTGVCAVAERGASAESPTRRAKARYATHRNGRNEGRGEMRLASLGEVEMGSKGKSGRGEGGKGRTSGTDVTDGPGRYGKQTTLQRQESLLRTFAIRRVELVKKRVFF